MSYRLFASLLLSPFWAKAEWRQLPQATEAAESASAITWLIGVFALAGLLLLLSLLAPLLLLFVNKMIWLWLAGGSYVLLGLLQFSFLRRARGLGGVQRQLGLGYGFAFWIGSNFSLGFLFLVVGFAAGLLALSLLGVFAWLLAFGLVLWARAD